jgi:hypothetical protein
MTSGASNDDDTEASGFASFPLPRHLTPQARVRFVGAVREYELIDFALPWRGGR